MKKQFVIGGVLSALAIGTPGAQAAGSGSDSSANRIGDSLFTSGGAVRDVFGTKSNTSFTDVKIFNNSTTTISPSKGAAGGDSARAAQVNYDDSD